MLASSFKCKYELELCVFARSHKSTQTTYVLKINHLTQWHTFCIRLKQTKEINIQNMLQHDFKVALRNLLKNKGQTLISIIGLAVGLFCFSLCTYLVRYWMSEDDGFTNKNRIAEIVLTSEKGRLKSGTPSYLGSELQSRQFGAIERITVTTYDRQMNLSFEITEDKTLPYKMLVVETDTNFLSVFGTQLLTGDIHTINKSPNTVLLSQTIADKIYKDENPVGKQVIDEDQRAYTIGGIFEDLPRNNSINPYEPIGILALSVLDGELSQPKSIILSGCTTYALLSKGFKATDLDNSLRTADYKIWSEENECWVVKALPLGHKKYLAIGSKMFNGFIFFIGLLILLSALLNYFSFFTGSFFNRIKEFSIRKGIGENKIQLFLLLFIELFLSLILSGILALCLVELFIPGFQFSFFRVQIEFDSLLLSRQIGEYLLICLGIAAIICGSVCVRLNRISLMEGIRFSRHRVRNTLLGIQFVIALLFLTGAAIAIFQAKEGERQLFNSLTNQEKERIFFVRTDHKYLDDTRDVLFSRLKENSMVEDILQIQDKLTNTQIYGYEWNEKQNHIVGGILFVSANAGSFLGLQPLIGTLQLDAQSILVNETFMHVMKENPLGKVIKMNNDPTEYKVNGVSSSLLRFVDGSEYFASIAIALLKEGGNCYVRIQEGEEEAGKTFLLKTVKDLLPESIEPEVFSLKDECKHVQTTERMLGNIFLFFACVSLIITTLGIYSSISQDTERRQKEVAIRKINGASLTTILQLFARLYIKILLIATFFVFPIMWLATDVFLKSWVIRFNYNNPLFWIGIFLLAALVTGFTIIFRILKTAQLNPAAVIKSE